MAGAAVVGDAATEAAVDAAVATTLNMDGGQRGCRRGPMGQLGHRGWGHVADITLAGAQREKGPVTG